MPTLFNDKFINDIKQSVICDEVLDLRAHEIDDEKAILLANALKENIHIKVVYLAENNIRDKGIIALASVSHLEELDVSTNEFESSCLEALATSNLKVLNISNNKVGGGIAFLGGSSSLRELDASACEISGEDIVEFVKKVKKAKEGSNFEILYLSNNQIDDLGAKALAQIKIATRLDLTGNEINDKNIFNGYMAKRLNLNQNPCTMDNDLKSALEEDSDFGWETKETQFSKIESKITESVSKDEAKKVSCGEGLFKGTTPINKGSTEEDKKLTAGNKSPLSRQ